jgi:hypothetical protein
MIIQRVHLNDFIKAFKDHGRESNFSDGALSSLWDYYEDISEDTETPFELDVVAICCDWQELTFKEACEQTGCEDIEDVNDNHFVLMVDPEEETCLLSN